MSDAFAGTRSVVLDVDSTLAGIEGIDWLAALRPAAVARNIARLTREAMDGKRVLEEVYGARLKAVAPTRAEVEALGAAYVAAIAPGAAEFVRDMKLAGMRVVMVSGGIRQALLPLATQLGVENDDIHGVGIRFNSDGGYEDFDHENPLTRHLGKAECVRGLGLDPRVVAVGDGSTDLAIRAEGACDAFVAYTGFARREDVVAGADAVCGSFVDLPTLLLPSR